MHNHFNTTESSIPPEWRLVMLKDIAKKMFGGGTPSTKNPKYWDGNQPWITTAIIDQDDIYLEKYQRCITQEGLTNSSAKVAPKGSVLIGTRVGVGKAAVASFDVAINQDLTAFIPTEDVLSEFLVLSLKQSSIQFWFDNNKRGATIKGVPRTDMANIGIILPPIPEQQAIANVLRTVQQAKEATEKVIATAQTLKQSLMRHTFTYGPVPHHEADKVSLRELETGLFPTTWDVSKVNNIAELKYGYRTSIPKMPPPNGIDIISTAEITNEGELKLEKIRTVEIPDNFIERFNVQKNDILFNWRNAQKHVGKTALVEDDFEAPTIFASFIIRLRTGKKIQPKFLHYLLTELRRRQIFFKKSRRAVNQANFNANELGALPIAFPSTNEQSRICAIIEKVEEKLDTEVRRRNAIEEIFRTLLHLLMTGQFRLNNL